MHAAVQRIFGILHSAGALTQTSAGAPGSASLPLAVAAVKLIGSGPAAESTPTNARSALGSWVTDVAALEPEIAEAWAQLCTSCDVTTCRLQPPPLVTLCMGAAGQLTRVLNQHLTPVTHELLPVAAAPGQLSARQIMQQRRDLGLLQPARRYYLFGHPVGGSPSPAMHNTAFAAAGLLPVEGSSAGYQYDRVDTSAAADVAATLSLDSTHHRGAGGSAHVAAGGNVTIPLKQDVLPLCNSLSLQAAAIGAVNTLCLHRLPGSGSEGGPSSAAHTAVAGGPDIHVHGANTDWLGIARPLGFRLQRMGAAAGAGSEHAPAHLRIGIVVGAGGTSLAAGLALLSLGLTVVVHNPRTPAKGAEVASRLLQVAAAVGAADMQPRVVCVTDLSAPEAFQRQLRMDLSGSSGPVDRSLDAAPLAPTIAALVSTIPASVGWTAPEWLLAGGPLPSISSVDSSVSAESSAAFSLAATAATPAASALAGSSGVTSGRLQPVVFDVAYRPRVTPLLAQARAAGCEIIEGAEMLVHQGAAAWAIWTQRQQFGYALQGVPSGAPSAVSADASSAAIDARPPPLRVAGAPCLSMAAHLMCGSLPAEAEGAGREVGVGRDAASSAAATGAVPCLIGVPFAEMADAVYAALDASVP
jgi:shikimate 5-dehydrogenase